MYIPLDSSHYCGSIVVIESRATIGLHTMHDVLSGLRYSMPQ